MFTIFDGVTVDEVMSNKRLVIEVVSDRPDTPERAVTAMIKRPRCGTGKNSDPYFGPEVVSNGSVLFVPVITSGNWTLGPFRYGLLTSNHKILAWCDFGMTVTLEPNSFFQPFPSKSSSVVLARLPSIVTTR